MLQYFTSPVSSAQNSLKMLRLDILGPYELFPKENYIVIIWLNDIKYIQPEE